MMRKEMESYPFQIKKDEQHMELPPGFRFHPTDEELITHYLSHKVIDSCFCARAIGEVDLNKCEPWDLPWRAKMGEKEWYFFCLRDRKYPTGLRTNRATGAGYWKATGKDREIYRGRTLVGMKKTLVFYGGRAPKGVKSDWVMHEYRLEGRQSYNLPKKTKNEWAICRVFQKSAVGEKTHMSGMVRLPSLTDSSTNPGEPQTGTAAARVICSIPSEEDHNAHLGPMMNQAVSSSSAAAILQSPVSLLPPSLFPAPQPKMGAVGMKENHQVYRDYGLDDHSILGIVVGNLGSDGWESPGVEFSRDTEEMSNHEMGPRSVGDPEEDGSGSGGPVDIDCLWTY